MQTRAAVAGRVALGGTLSLLSVLFVHELASFGLGHGLVRWSDTGCAAGDCAGIGLIVVTLGMTAVVLAPIFALAGAVTARWARRLPVLSALWLCLVILLLMQTANGYRAAFGATWLWYEPFVELMFQPLLTPALLVAGVAAFWMWVAAPLSFGTNPNRG
jgi:hypothetical protein